MLDPAKIDDAIAKMAEVLDAHGLAKGTIQMKSVRRAPETSSPIVFEVEEGPVFVLRRYEVKGDLATDAGAYKKLLSLKSKDPCSRARKLLADIQKIGEIHDKQGRQERPPGTAADPGRRQEQHGRRHPDDHRPGEAQAVASASAARKQEMTRSPGKAAFAFIFATVCLDMLALGIIVPVLPALVVRLEHGDYARAASMTGIFGFAWAAMQFVFSPVQGVLSDRYGRRPVVLLSNFGLGVDYLVMAVAPNIAWLFAGRLVSGICSASFSTATAYIADVTPPDKRAGRFGMLGAAFGIGFIIGPAVGGFLGHVSLRLPFWAAAVLSLANAAYGLFVLPESLPKEKRQAPSFAKANPFGNRGASTSRPDDRCVCARVVPILPLA